MNDPLPPNPRIAVIGSGAVGCYFGGRLAQHGHDVHFLFRGDYSAVIERGLVVKSCHGDFSLSARSLNVYNDPAHMPKADLVFVTLKTTANGEFDSLIRPLLHEQTAILTIQNGLGNEDALARLFGVQRILGGVAFVCINREGPGRIHHIDHGLIRLGEFQTSPGFNSRSPRAESIVSLFVSSQLHCQIEDDLRQGRWAKLVWNVPFNGLGAAMDLTTDRIIGSPSGRQLAARIMREVIAAARSDGAALSEDDAGTERIIAAQIEHTQSMGAYLTSMQLDRRHGRPLEVEAIIGEPLRRAASADIPTPLMRNLYDLLQVFT